MNTTKIGCTCVLREGMKLYLPSTQSTFEIKSKFDLNLIIDRITNHKEKWEIINEPINARL